MPVLVAHPHEQAVARETGVVDQDVEVAGAFHECLRRLRVGDVGLDRAAADLCRDGFRLVPPRAVADDHLGARAAELERDGAPDTP